IGFTEREYDYAVKIGGLPLQKYKISDHPKQYRLPIGRLCRGVPPWTPVIFPKLELLRNIVRICP
ncbi:MAG TPA: hypothetical protein VK186_18310, partial [Candidatus Deferrimicrobium sp.]|nr:hypothetical protein [Candidatus Deferrimicrobium sp.]